MRPRLLWDEEMHRQALALRLAGKSWTELARALGVSTSLARYHLRNAIYSRAQSIGETSAANREDLSRYFPPRPKPLSGNELAQMAIAEGRWLAEHEPRKIKAKRHG